MKIKVKLGLCFGAQVLLAALLSTGVLFGIHSVKRQFSYAVKHDAAVIANARHLSKLVVDMETGQRGFCLTFKEEFLEPYTSGSRAFTALTREEKKLVSDNPSQIAAIERIEHLVSQWQEKAAEPEIAMARKVGAHEMSLEYLQKVLGRGVGKTIMDEIRGTIHAMEASFRINGNTKGEHLVMRAAKAMIDQETGQRGFIITGKEQFLKPFTDGREAFHQAVTDLRDLNSKSHAMPDLERNIGTLEKLATDWHIKAAGPEIAARRELNAHPESQKDVTALLETGTGKALIDEIRREFDKFIETESKLTEDRYTTASQTTAWTRNMAACLLVLAICIGVTIAVLVGGRISRSLAELASGADAIGKGDLYQRIDIRTNDEIGELAQCFNKMVVSLREAEQDIRRSEAKFRALYNSTSDAVMLLDRNGFFDCNDAALRMFGSKDKAEFCSRPLADLSPAEQPCGTDSMTLAVEHISIALETGSNLFEWIYKQPDTDKGFPAEVMLTAVELNGHSVCQAVVRDITERKQAEQQIRDYAAVVESNNLALEELNRMAEAANHSKSDFLANMSHEIRTPMTAILGFSDILVSCVTDDKQRDAATTIRQNGEYLLEIINDILDLSKIESGKLIVETIECSPGKILADVLSLMSVRAECRNIALHIEFANAIPRTIQSDPTRLKQILINLIGNAIKFTDVGEVRLVARLLNERDEEPRMQFAVSDSGIGMTDEQMDALFVPFSQADSSTTREYGGTGLGLTISKRLTEKLGGGIAVASVLGEGSTFTFSVVTGSLDGIEMLSAPTDFEVLIDMNRASPAGQQELDCRILLAEDGHVNQRLITLLLEDAGAKVSVAGNGKLAYDLALESWGEGRPFDVILMDMQMPVMDGYTATSKLRDARYTGPVIALTAHAMSTDRDKCLNAGCDDYLTKPIDNERMISLIAEYASLKEFHKTNGA